MLPLSVAIEELCRRARRVGMSPYAYAVHTGNAGLLKTASIYRAMYEDGYADQVLQRRASSCGKRYDRIGLSQKATALSDVTTR